MFNSLFLNFLATDVDASCSYSFLKAMWFASLSCKFLYKLFTSRDIRFSLGSIPMLSKISLTSIELVSIIEVSRFRGFKKKMQEPCSGYTRS